MIADKDQNLVWLIDDEFDSFEIESEMLKKKGYRLKVSRGTQYRKDYPKYAAKAEALLVWIGHCISAKDIEGLHNCKVIAIRGGGYNNIDIAAATRHGIGVTYVPGYCIEEVSEHTLALILYFTRRLHECKQMTGAGGWRADKITPPRRLNTQILGLIGLGKIACAVARKAQCLGFEIWAYDTFVDNAVVEGLGLKPASFKEIIHSADFISLHVPLTKDTYHLFNAEIFKLMKPSAILINTCRGEVIDEAALIKALTSRKISGAGLDVMSQEPPDPKNPLLNMPNVLVTPHSAYISQDALTEVLVRSTQSAIDAMEGKEPFGLINRKNKKSERR